jgi:hypothetical protein
MQRFEISLETLHVARLLHQFEQQQTVSLRNELQTHHCRHPSESIKSQSDRTLN